MNKLSLKREKQGTGSAKAESGFIPEGAIGKTGVPAKFTLWGDSTVGLSYKAEPQ